MIRKAEQQFFISKILETFADDLKRHDALPPNAIKETLSKDPFSLPKNDLEQIRKNLEYQFSVIQDKGATVKTEFHPWLEQVRKDVKFHFWNRLRNYYLHDDILPPNVVSQLDNVTDEVLDYCGNPLDPSEWKRRGMVIGHVQSGKTTNYASLIAKAADVGYKIVILLAGLSNTLRDQTQERIDETFIGKKSVLNAMHSDIMPIMYHCKERRDKLRLHPAFGTTRNEDFSKKAVRSLGVSLGNLRDPIIFVTKKNKTILENLLDWISNQASGHTIDYPLLLIDDEADNASINTHIDPKRSTAINETIRRILSKFNRSTYVGYTATPFANIFVDPDSEDEMIGHDLFPCHFIKALDPPSNYVGADKMFVEGGKFREHMIRQIDDYIDIIPMDHDRYIKVEELPKSLQIAIMNFVLVRAIRILRGDGHKHCSMMINVSRFNDVQEQILGLVYKFQTQITDAIRVNAGLGREALQDQIINQLYEVFKKEYNTIDIKFDDVLAVLAEASSSIKVRAVNMLNNKPLDYSGNVKTGLHVIVIGGLALSRGLTLEGLCVTYMVRNAGASDTLMQMARWFGYRRDYEDLCRLYITESSVHHYEYVTEAIEELREEVKTMAQNNATPAEFGLKVRHSELGIRVTAANKMRSATRVQLAQDFGGRIIEGNTLANNADTNQSNMKCAISYLQTLGSPVDKSTFCDEVQQKEAEQHLVWVSVEGKDLLDFVQSFKFHASHPSLGFIDGRSSLFIDYCLERVNTELTTWDVVVPLRQGRNPKKSEINFDNLDVGTGKEILPIRTRNTGEIREIYGNSAFSMAGSNRGTRLIAPRSDPQLLMSNIDREAVIEREQKINRRSERFYCSRRLRPMMLVHFFDTRELGKELKNFVLSGNTVVSLSFLMPSTAFLSEPKTYEVNTVYRRHQLELELNEDEEFENG